MVVFLSGANFGVSRSELLAGFIKTESRSYGKIKSDTKSDTKSGKTEGAAIGSLLGDFGDNDGLPDRSSPGVLRSDCASLPLKNPSIAVRLAAPPGDCRGAHTEAGQRLGGRGKIPARRSAPGGTASYHRSSRRPLSLKFAPIVCQAASVCVRVTVYPSCSKRRI